MTGVLHTARINAIEVIVRSDKLIKMVKYEHKFIQIIKPAKSVNPSTVCESQHRCH